MPLTYHPGPQLDRPYQTGAKWPFHLVHLSADLAPTPSTGPRSGPAHAKRITTKFVASRPWVCVCIWPVPYEDIAWLRVNPVHTPGSCFDSWEQVHNASVSVVSVARSRSNVFPPVPGPKVCDWEDREQHHEDRRRRRRHRLNRSPLSKTTAARVPCCRFDERTPRVVVRHSSVLLVRDVFWDSRPTFRQNWTFWTVALYLNFTVVLAD